MKDTRPRLLMRYVATCTLPVQGVCWDCEKPFGPRAVESFRGVREDGALLTHTICVRCAVKEQRVIDRGTHRYPGRKIIGWAMLALATVAGFGFSLAGLEPWATALLVCTYPVLTVSGFLLVFGLPKSLRHIIPKGTKW